MSKPIKPMPPSPLAEVDYAEIEKRVMAQMTRAFGVEEKVLRHGLNSYPGLDVLHGKTITGRWPARPEAQKLPTTNKAGEDDD